jgi:hypothetical protein
VELLSDDECRYLAHTVGDIAAGERFWEGDFGLLYNEYAKLRYFKVGRQAPSALVVSWRGALPVLRGLSRDRRPRAAGAPQCSTTAPTRALGCR